MDIIKAETLGDSAQDKLCKVFIDAFYKDFSDISRNRDKLYRAFKHIFLVEYFNVAMIDDEVAGIIACTDGFNNSMKISSRVFRNEFGTIKGTLISLLLKKNFQKKPIKRDKSIGFIEVVATNPTFQNRGVGTALFNHVFNKPEFNRYILEVASNNSAGISLYKKLGFRELYKKKHIFAKQSGIDYFIWMER